ncbi:MAG TPA: hypothetical protein VE867_04225 [Candidatus Binatia bacterium]|nr:hypothetical protein [Candidatus Binatia bacterium]
MTLRFSAVQLPATIAIAIARDDAPLAPVRPWAPPPLPDGTGVCSDG